MKRVLIGVFLMLFLMGLVLGIEEPNPEFGGSDVEAIKEAIDTYIPIDEGSGEINFSGYKPFQSKAEIRIAAINLWLEENASWLKVVLGMVPSISVLFAINLFLFLFLFVSLVLNGKVFDIIISDKRVDLLLFDVSMGNIFGLVVFLIMLFSKLIFWVAVFFHKLWLIIWIYVLPYGLLIAGVVALITGILFVTLMTFLPKMMAPLILWMEERKKIRAARKEEINRQALENITNEITR